MDDTSQHKTNLAWSRLRERKKEKPELDGTAGLCQSLRLDFTLIDSRVCLFLPTYPPSRLPHRCIARGKRYRNLYNCIINAFERRVAGNIVLARSFKTAD